MVCYPVNVVDCICCILLVVVDCVVVEWGCGSWCIWWIEWHKMGPKMGLKNREKWAGGMGVLQKDFFGHTETRLDFWLKMTFFRRVAENEGLV